MSKVFSILNFALRSLALHKLRSSLTVLGIVFGVASVITMLAVGEGASKTAQESIRKLGSTNIIITSVDKQEEEDQNQRLRRYGVTDEDIGRIKAAVHDYTSISRQRIYQGEVRHSSGQAEATVIACDSNLFKVNSIPLKQGRALCNLDLDSKNNVCVIDGSLSRKLFPYEDPLTQKISFKGTYYQVVGVTKTTDSTRNFSNHNVYLPLTSALSNHGKIIVNQVNGAYSFEEVDAHKLIIKLPDTAAVYSASQKTQRVMQYSHPVQDYKIQVPIKLLEQAAETKRMFSILLGSIAGISLLVGGIGIMNIMLATVSERTKEIGLRRAIGAKRKDIIIQFISEAIVLSLIGGIMGVFLGVLIPILITAFTGIETQLSFFAIALAFLISGLTGIIFGSYPAMKSASLSPIEALRDV